MNNELIFINALKQLLESHDAKIVVGEDNNLRFEFAHQQYYIGVGDNFIDPKSNQLFWTYLNGWNAGCIG